MDTYALGIIACEGADAAHFLQGQLSANTLTLTPSQGAFACYLNLKGRVMAFMVVVKRPEGFWLILPRELIPSFMHKLQKFILFSKATLKDISDQYAITGDVRDPFEGPRCAVHETQHRIVVDIDPTSGLIWEIIASNNSTTGLPITYMLAQFNALIPWIGSAQTDQFLPHYINLVNLGAIAFDKGCFVGQEIVARMQYRGHANKTLRFVSGSNADLDAYAPDTVNRIDIGALSYGLIVLSTL